MKKVILSKTPEYQIYHQMLQRCYNPNNEKYKDYGARNIKVCERWLGLYGFKNFIEDMGQRPGEKYEYSIERIDVNGNYDVNNCKWILLSEQTMNKRKTAKLNTGDVFGKLTILEEVESKDRNGSVPNLKRRMFLCKCECGKEVIKRMDKLRQGEITTCGTKPCNKYSNKNNLL